VPTVAPTTGGHQPTSAHGVSLSAVVAVYTWAAAFSPETHRNHTLFKGENTVLYRGSSKKNVEKIGTTCKIQLLLKNRDYL